MSFEAKTTKEICGISKQAVTDLESQFCDEFTQGSIQRQKWVPLEEAPKEIEAIKKANETFVYSKFHGYKICVPIEELELKTIENNQLKAKIVEANKILDSFNEPYSERDRVLQKRLREALK
jgi:hypothetical protein